MPPRSKEKMQYWHKLFLQALMSRGYMRGQEVFVMVKEILQNNELKKMKNFPQVRFENNEYVQQDSAEILDDFREIINRHLDPLGFQVKIGVGELLEEGKYTQYYVLCPVGSFQGLPKLQKAYSELELDWLRLVCEHLVDEVPDHLDTEMKLINLGILGKDLKKRLNPYDNAQYLKTFERDGYLVRLNKRSKGGSSRFGLGTRLLMELEDWLLLNTNITKCKICDVIVCFAATCGDCDLFYHKRCLENRHSKCTSCKQVIKMEGVAAKR